MTIIHDQDNSRFYQHIENTDEPAELLYNTSGRSVDFYRTYVPPQARGGKLAYELVNAGLQWARNENLQIHASCWYVEKFLEKENRGK